MSKISPMQAAALGLKPNNTKPNVVKTAASKPVASVVTPKPTMSKAAAPKPTIKAAAVTTAPKIVAPKKPAVKTVNVKPAITNIVAKPSAKPVSKTVARKPAAKPKADNGKKDKKNDHKNDHHNNNHKKDDKKAKPEKAKVEKIRMERDSFTMPKEEYAQLTLLKARLTSMGQPAKKSELLRAGIKLLAAMSDNTLKTTLAKIPVIKTGRPNKKD